MASKETSDNSGTNKVVISVVDDDRSVRSAISSLLRSEGFASRSFESAEDFLESGLKSVTRCLILDVRMKGMSGLELQSVLIGAGVATPTVFISAHADSGARARAMNSGAVAFLSKPFSKEELLSCVQAALAIRP